MKKKKPRLFAVDGNWYAFRAAYTSKSKRDLKDVLPYTLLSMICKDAIELRADLVLVAFDGPKVFRKDLYPKYKANRDGKIGSGDEYGEYEDGPSLKEQVYGAFPQIFDLFLRVGLPFYQPRKYEADDVLASLAHQYHQDMVVICGTQDKDAYQYLLWDSVRLYDSSAKGKDGKRRPRFIDRPRAEKAKGVTIEQMVDYQTLLGDSVDNIAPAKFDGKDITPSVAKKILEEYGSVKNWIAQNREQLVPQLEHLRLNRKLVQLVTDVVPPGDPADWKLSKIKPKEAQSLSWNFHALHNHMWPRSKGLF